MKDRFLLLQILVLLALIVNIFLLTDSVPFANNENDDSSFSITLLTMPDCERCFSLDPFKEYFFENGILESQVKEVPAKSLLGKWVTFKNKITQVPTAIIEGPVNDEAFMKELVDAVAEERDGQYIVTRLQPPYYDLDEKRVVGDFDVILLDDESCEECYDISLHDEVLDRLVMTPNEKTVVDAASEEGVSLIEEYQITAVPTLIFQGELDVYTQLVDIWGQVGTVEQDGSYILRRGVESMGPYKTLPQGEIIYPVLEEQQPEEE